MPWPELSTWHRVLGRVTALEWSSRALPASPRPRRFRVQGQAGWSDAHGQDLVVQTDGEVCEVVTTLPSPTAASAVVMGKFDAASGFRLRSFYPRQGVTLRLQAQGRRNGIERSVAAFEAIGRHDPTLIPQLLDHGSSRGAERSYLVEAMVEGRMAKADDVHTIAGEIAERLLHVQRKVGMTSTALSEIAHPLLGERWSTFAEEHELDPALARSVHKLIKRDDHLIVSLGHGDLVASNISLGAAGLTLLDWEYAGPQPIAFDLAKLHISARRPRLTFESIRPVLATELDAKRGHYSCAEQVALGHVQFLSWHAERSKRAQLSGRGNYLAVATRRRVLRIGQLLADG